ncbi:slipin family protein [Bdellovibrio bacteriovorus]|uniref:Band 7 protein n=1 Tax=Bdellovibrio bacteriovorus str. Tiberius TaxID=1069642 RepID=K7YZ37_BDEBC|nr:slipin family protein [Bdellovibrio bacteriovorus]AFY01940.1 band 7 protein [Bdellovibrio bacteriovorus str. Tiberius]
MEFIIGIIVIGGIIGSSMIKILNDWERGVVLRLGKAVGVRGPGLILLIPFVERMIKIDTRTITMDVQPQDVITKDNVSMQVNAVVYFKVISPMEAITKIEDYYFATSQLAQTTLRSVMGQYHLDDVLEHRDKINAALQVILDKATESWGIKVTMVEVKQIDLPKEMQRAMAREAEAERERRAKVISAEGEVQRAQKLQEASNTLAGSPSALQLAYLQTLTEIAGDKSNTILFPLPLDMIKPFMEMTKKEN